MPLFPQMYEAARDSDEWYARVPEAIASCIKWLGDATAELLKEGKVCPEQEQYLAAIVRMAVHADRLLASGFGPYAAQGYRTLLERSAIVAASTSQERSDWLANVALLNHNNVSERKRATEGFVARTALEVDDFQALYDILSQRFTHVTVADSVPLVDPFMLEPGLEYRTKDGQIDRGYWVFALTLADVLLVTVRAVNTLEPGLESPPVLKGNLQDQLTMPYVEACKAWLCDTLTPKSPGKLMYALPNIRGIPGQVVFFDMHRRSMTVHHLSDDPETVDKDVKNAIFQMTALFALGNDWSKKDAKIHDRGAHQTGRKYEIKWPASTEVSWVAMGMLASHFTLSQPVDYIGEMQRRS